MKAVAGCLLVMVLISCGGAERRGRGAEQSAGQPAEVPPPDSLALALPGGAEIWFTASRQARSADDRPCVERVMEIRESGTRRMIPLLYTGEPPRRINDSTIEAAIWLNCRPGNVYQVNIRTGQPVRVK